MSKGKYVKPAHAGYLESLRALKEIARIDLGMMGEWPTAPVDLQSVMYLQGPQMQIPETEAPDVRDVIDMPPRYVSSIESRDFYETLFEARDDIFGRGSVALALSDPKSEIPDNTIHCSECGGDVIKREEIYACSVCGVSVQDIIFGVVGFPTTQEEKDEIEIYYRNRETDVRGDVE